MLPPHEVNTISPVKIFTCGNFFFTTHFTDEKFSHFVLFGIFHFVPVPFLIAFSVFFTSNACLIPLPLPSLYLSSLSCHKKLIDTIAIDTKSELEKNKTEIEQHFFNILLMLFCRCNSYFSENCVYGKKSFKIIFRKNKRFFTFGKKNSENFDVSTVVSFLYKL